jgi:hypothetical protein
MASKIIKKPAGLKETPAATTPANTHNSLSTPQTAAATGYVPAAPSAGSVGTSIPRYSSSYDRPDINTTKAITNAVYQNLMGKDATPAEIQQYHADYVKYAASHPTSTSSSMIDTSGLERQSSSFQSGISESNFINNLVSGKAETKAYTSATTYMDAIQNYVNKTKGLY